MKPLATLLDWLVAVSYSIVITVYLTCVINVIFWKCSTTAVDHECSPLNTMAEEAYQTAWGMVVVTVLAVVYRTRLPRLIRYCASLILIYFGSVITLEALRAITDSAVIKYYTEPYFIPMRYLYILLLVKAD